MTAAPWATERIRCGASHPDARIDADLQDMRDSLNFPKDTSGCGASAIWSVMYRCVECARWFHRDCARKHFAAHGALSGGSPPAPHQTREETE